ncbi:2Fe-2S ferredoxin-type domain-containing protein [Catenaria anguillulae PL171]|uniref:2Fe-2S ferredoxin-type domain-containing protein n=1 Tax=Catenaria anguillulae PL171 TaxID=765915 RepID=A0A1Y2HLV6_9FUNG|nr:2Fe-2S ferredoxin-type domain-containing protein [Catenaria anguillulae PL171]
MRAAISLAAPRHVAPVAMFARSWSSSPILAHGKKKNSADLPYSVTYVTPEGEKVTVKAEDGDTLLDLAHQHDIELEGACEGSLACSTCHVIVDPAFYDKMEEPTDEENDMLDLAFGLTDTSRLGCQVQMCKELDGIKVTIPSVTRNMAVDGTLAYCPSVVFISLPVPMHLFISSLANPSILVLVYRICLKTDRLVHLLSPSFNTPLTRIQTETALSLYCNWASIYTHMCSFS